MELAGKGVIATVVIVMISIALITVIVANSQDAVYEDTYTLIPNESQTITSGVAFTLDNVPLSGTSLTDGSLIIYNNSADYPLIGLDNLTISDYDTSEMTLTDTGIESINVTYNVVSQTTREGVSSGAVSLIAITAFLIVCTIILYAKKKFL